MRRDATSPLRGIGRNGEDLMSEHNILSLPYNQRRIIVVTDALPADTEPSLSVRPNALKTAWLMIAAGPLVGVAVKVLLNAVQKMREGGEELVPVSWTDAERLRFPIGHPRKNVVYIGHPVDPPAYIPIADFHRFLFEHKVAEAQRLIRSLGALTIEVIRIEGWDRGAGVNVGISIPATPETPKVDANVTTSREAGSSRAVLATMKLRPTKPPHIPDGLVWLSHEPLWQEVAQARLESGLDAFVIDVRSTDDYGINANLKALVTNSGLEMGGTFVEHRDTVWRLQGTFSPTTTA
jgi:hypothetical protein